MKSVSAPAVILIVCAGVLGALAIHNQAWPNLTRHSAGCPAAHLAR